MKANVYVDGFNLYYSALRWRFPDCKWLDVRKLAELLLPNDGIAEVKYFTARVSSEPDNPNQHRRQQSYLRALAATGVEPIYGNFQTQERWMRRETPCETPGCATPGPRERVIYREEKGSDVNLGAHLLMDAFRQRYDVAAVVTNDTDLIEPIRMARNELGVKIMLLAPNPRPAARLIASVDGVRPIRHGALSAAQLPLTLQDRKGEIHRPREWRPGKS